MAAVIPPDLEALDSEEPSIISSVAPIPGAWVSPFRSSWPLAYWVPCFFSRCAAEAARNLARDAGRAFCAE
jgi:hypothetical protein